MAGNPLVGVWRLVSWESRTADGEATYPLGQDARGYITYSDDGHLSVIIGKADRPRFSGNDLLGGSAEEKAGAAATFVSYAGTYELQGDRVIHHIELSLFPNWAGTTQERKVELRGNRLTLSTRAMVHGRFGTSSLTWERV